VHELVFNMSVLNVNGSGGGGSGGASDDNNDHAAKISAQH
jgi:hypothetical protein